MADTYYLKKALVFNALGTKIDAIASIVTKEELLKNKPFFSFDFYTLSNTNIVYKICDVDQPKIIQGLVAFRHERGVLSCANMETNIHNRNSPGLYGNTGKAMVSLCCKYSFDNEMEGFITFEAKSRLIPYYKRMGAYLVNDIRMVIGEQEAKKLIDLYF